MIKTKREAQLEKYMAKRLKQEARPAILAALQQQQSTQGLSLLSSKNLGVKKADLKKNDLKNIKVGPDSQPEDSSSSSSSSSASDYEGFANVEAPFKQNHFVEKAPKQPKQQAEEASEDELPIKSSVNSIIPAKFVLIERDPVIQEQREQLPIFREEQRIMECIKDNPVCCLVGETGSGKTTQVPQFCLEAGYEGLIGITQPRRVAAISMAQRVGLELNNPAWVSYQVRHDRGTLGKDTRIKFMTDGILLRELQSDFLLRRYSIICLDEAHERNLNTDILIGMLSRIVKLRNKLHERDPFEVMPLRLVIMSATLDVDRIVNNGRLFPEGPPPVIRVEARQHPVTIHWTPHTPTDHVQAAHRLVKRIHTRLPPGTILVFLTGRRDIQHLAHLLRTSFPPQQFGCGMGESIESGVSEASEDSEVSEASEESEVSEASEETEVSEASEENGESSADEKSDDGEESSAEDLGHAEGISRDRPLTLRVLPLYSAMAPEQQMRIFEPAKEGERICVIATNIAETSITIPNVRYVVDGGRVKEKRVDPVSGVESYSVEWTSKASSQQRAGRAGRTAAGHCYRLYSSAVYERLLPDYSPAEIERASIEGLVLTLKCMGIDHPSRFPLPTAPHPEALETAQRVLTMLGAIDGERGQVTEMGRAMGLVPLAPRWASLLHLGLQTRSLRSLSVALAAVLSLGEPFTSTESTEEESAPQDKDKDGEGKKSLRVIKLNLAGKPNGGDLMAWLEAFLGYAACAPGEHASYCHRLQLRPKIMQEMLQQYAHLKRSHSDLDKLPIRLAHEQRLALCRLIGMVLKDRQVDRIKSPRKGLVAYQDAQGTVYYLHPSSCLYSCPPKQAVWMESMQIEEDCISLKGLTPQITK